MHLGAADAAAEQGGVRGAGSRDRDPRHLPHVPRQIHVRDRSALRGSGPSRRAGGQGLHDVGRGRVRGHHRQRRGAPGRLPGLLPRRDARGAGGAADRGGEAVLEAARAGTGAGHRGADHVHRGEHERRRARSRVHVLAAAVVGREDRAERGAAGKAEDRPEAGGDDR